MTDSMRSLPPPWPDRHCEAFSTLRLEHFEDGLVLPFSYPAAHRVTDDPVSAFRRP